MERMPGVKKTEDADCLLLYPDFLTEQVAAGLTKHKHEAVLEIAGTSQHLWLEIVEVMTEGGSTKILFQAYDPKLSQHLFVLFTRVDAKPWLFKEAYVVSRAAYQRHNKETLHAYLLST